MARKYFTKENRTVAIWTRNGGRGRRRTRRSPACRPRRRAWRGRCSRRIESATDAAQLQQMIERLDAMGAQVPPEMKPAIDLVRAKAQAKLDALSKSSK